LLKIVDGFADSGVVNDLLFVRGSGDEGGGAKLINVAREALGVVGDALKSIVGEEGILLEASDLEMVADIGEGDFKRKPGQARAGSTK
jgi:hypothetical protein